MSLSDSNKLNSYIKKCASFTISHFPSNLSAEQGLKIFRENRWFLSRNHLQYIDLSHSVAFTWIKSPLSQTHTHTQTHKHTHTDIHKATETHTDRHTQPHSEGPKHTDKHTDAYTPRRGIPDTATLIQKFRETHKNPYGILDIQSTQTNRHEESHSHRQTRTDQKDVHRKTTLNSLQHNLIVQ